MRYASTLQRPSSPSLGPYLIPLLKLLPMDWSVAGAQKPLAMQASHLRTCTNARLHGPCFKKGRMELIESTCCWPVQSHWLRGFCLLTKGYCGGPLRLPIKVEAWVSQSET